MKAMLKRLEKLDAREEKACKKEGEAMVKKLRQGGALVGKIALSSLPRGKTELHRACAFAERLLCQTIFSLTGIMVAVKTTIKTDRRTKCHVVKMRFTKV